MNKPDRFNSFADLANTTGGVSPKKVLTTKKRQGDHHDQSPAIITSGLFNKADLHQQRDHHTQSVSKHTPNIGWMFYKDYFKGIDFSYVSGNKNVEDKNAETIARKNFQIIEKTSLKKIEDELGDKEQNIDLEVVYPGLITGIGITHEAGVEGEFKLGLHFDYTYGMPIIHGSSVKGLLRSVFPNFKKGKDKNPESKLE